MNLREAVIEANTIYSTTPPQPAAAEPCATCPFRTGNDRKLARLAPEMSHPDMPLAWAARFIQPIMRLLARVAPKFVAWNTRKFAAAMAAHKPFLCHSTIYKFANGRLARVRDQSEWRLCAGTEGQ